MADTSAQPDSLLFEAVDAALTDVAPDARVAVAYSGGVDSTALLHVLAARRPGRVVALHVHHGLQPDADAWQDHCRREAESLGVAFDAERVSVDQKASSLESEARRMRYAALVQLCKRHDCAVLATAHHADDQAETVLLNLARGTGIAGLAATARRRLVDDVAIVRPFLDAGAATLRDYVAGHELAFVEDPSNADRRYTRNAIRHDVLPPLRRIAPSIATHLGRVASHAATLQALLDEIGVEDLEAAATDDEAKGDETMDLDRLAALSRPRAANALRVWLARRGLRAPSTAALSAMLDQLVNATDHAQIALLHERRTIRLYRGRVSLDDGHAQRATFEALTWDGGDEIAVPGWHGRLLVRPASERGLDTRALREHGLVARARRGGERLRLRPDGPSRTLKNLYQEHGIAAWQRDRLPLVYCGDQLVFAAGLGLNAGATTTTSPGVKLVELEWRADATVR